MGTSWLTYPLVSAGFDVQLTAPRCKVCKHDTNINRARESAGAETADRLGSDFRQIDRSNDSRLTDTEASNEAASVDLGHASTVCEEDDDTEDPETAELTGSPETTDAVTEKESAGV